MIKYIFKRIFYSFLTLIILVALTFFMMRLLPGDPFIGQKAIPETTLKALNEKYGLDKPMWQQLLIYFGNVFRGDLGISIHYNRPVNDIIRQAFPYSFDLGIRALIFATVMGILLGIIAAVKRGTHWDTLSMFLAIIGVSVPGFIVGSLLQYFFALKLTQWTGIAFFPNTGWNGFAAKILPSFALSLSSLATVSRLMRTSMMDVLSQDYIKTAKSKGLSQKAIVWKHAVRNAIMPVITVLGPISAALLTGAFVVENIFAIPGMGKFFVYSIQTQDHTMISGTTLFYGAFLIIANLLVDLAYGFIDPRVKLSEVKE
ncbi:oligopeptide transport system permease protein [Herbinix hemicellulosilytica]|uniref:Oligopeptide transport system permease protein OppB n=1 Tax=Herbinix hemicellulosilytica TaxID=1564487 RepID=A0A0H5SXQ2_HERHM|nr:ABC transporter permease [Herbinix hemicellulosilytica]RBP56457.1 oligopeptide transport system permease protein [Herbinix hemicellulosilytica]CRZ35133.1 Oligopeptide transport system permease protein OppB [Herbinix hemicellulosilytica]